MNTVTAAFTRKGILTASLIAGALGGKVYAPSRLCSEGVCAIDEALSIWAGRMFHEAEALVFVGACGIAVRAISPHITSKLTDPAVIVVDEAGHFVIPILSGHIGGANELARKVARLLNAQAVITTATDVNNLPAVDEWAVTHDCVIENAEVVKHVSGSLLEGERVGVAVTCDDVPAPFPVTLWLRPRVLVLGAGCNRGVSPAEFEECAHDFLKGAGVSELSLCAVASIDLKKDEPAIRAFAEAHAIDFRTFTASQLQALPGKFTASQTVMHYTGTDNVCERSAMLAAGEGAVLLRSKCVYGGITFALARKRILP